LKYELLGIRIEVDLNFGLFGSDIIELNDVPSELLISPPLFNCPLLVVIEREYGEIVALLEIPNKLE
jgi:hypothetical protein